MFEYLSTEEIDEIHAAAAEAGLMDERAALLAAIPAGFRTALVTSPRPATQTLLDLKKMNGIPRLTDGSVPLERWLRAAVSLSPLTPQQQIFRKYLDIVVVKASGNAHPAKALDDLPPAEEKIVDIDDTLPIGFLRAANAVVGSVVKLEVPCFVDGQAQIGAGGKPMRYVGTGWLIAPDLICTNYHVVNAREDGQPRATQADFICQGKKTIARFDFDDAQQEGTPVGIVAVEAADDSLDYAILRLGPGIPEPKRLPLTVNKAAFLLPPEHYKAVNIIQHPLGGAKVVAIRNNLARQVVGNEVQYFTDTQGGASGSPVFNDSWEVVALHRAARNVSNVSFQGKPTAVVNVGTAISAICQHIQDHTKLWPEIAPSVVG